MTKWTKEPPKEAGYYWVKHPCGYTSIEWCWQHRRGGNSGDVRYTTAIKRGYLWWPIPIPPPKEDQ